MLAYGEVRSFPTRLLGGQPLCSRCGGLISDAALSGAGASSLCACVHPGSAGAAGQLPHRPGRLRREQPGRRGARPHTPSPGSTERDPLRPGNPATCSTDASELRQLPTAVVIPRTIEDSVAAVFYYHRDSRKPGASVRVPPRVPGSPRPSRAHGHTQPPDRNDRPAAQPSGGWTTPRPVVRVRLRGGAAPGARPPGPPGRPRPDGPAGSPRPRGWGSARTGPPAVPGSTPPARSAVRADPSR